MTDLRRRTAVAALAVGALLPFARADAATDAAWAALKAGGHVLIVRHAQTVPGIGDPPEFTRGDCATQRNLSEAGREQSRALGRKLRDAGVAVADVLSSSWCRCIDTARLAFGRARTFEPLDSFFDDRRTEPAQTAALRERIAAFRGPGTLVMVTHQVNISALTSEVPAMGEGFVLAPGGQDGFRFVGRIPF